MEKNLRFLIGAISSPVFEGEDNGSKGATDDNPFKDFSPEQQSLVNKILSGEKQKHQAATQRAIDELNALKTKATMTAKEREELDSRLESLQSELLTKEQLASQEKDKLVKGHKKVVDELTTDRDLWKTRFTEYRIKNSITEAAALHDAFNPEQLVAILEPHTRLMDELDSEGRPSGNFIPKVKFNDTDKDGNPVKLDLSVSDAVKRMSEMDKFLNLFKGKGTGGLGAGGNAGKSGEIDPNELARKDPAKYMELRKSGKIKLS